jgi:beta-fructofuranosidase
VLYTAVDATDADRGRVRRALPVDETWTGWRKDEVVLTTPPEADVRAFRDPYVSSYDGGWRMLLAGGLADGSGALWVSYSQDLLDWTPPALAASGTEVGPLWECPSLLVVGGRQVLVVSVGGPGEQHAVAYAWCEVQGDRFVLGPWQVLTYGPSLYAASGFTEDSGEAGLIAWLRGVGDVEAGWMGAHSLPYRLSAVGERLVARPHPVLDGYRQGGVLRELLPACADLDWSPLPGDVLDASGLFRLEAVGGAVTVGLAGGSYELPWDGGPLRVVLDGPVLEVFGDGGVLAAPVPATGRDGVLTGSVERVVVHRLVGG